MKRLLLGLVLVLVCGVGLASAAPDITYVASGNQASSALVVASGKSVLFGGVAVKSNGSVTAYANVYCGTSVAGVLLFPGVATATGILGGGMLPYPVECTKGLYLELSGTGASAVLYYR